MTEKERCNKFEETLGKKMEVFCPNKIGQAVNIGGWSTLCLFCGYMLLRDVQSVSLRPGSVYFFAAFLFGLIVGISFVWRECMTFFYRIELYEGGFVVFNMSSFETVFWDDIECFKEKYYLEFLPIMLKPGKVAYRNKEKIYYVELKDGRIFSISSKKLSNHDILAKYIQQELSIRNVPWFVVESR